MSAKSDNGEILCEMIRIDEDLKRVINEEQGISRELECITYDVYDKIVDDIRQHKVYIIYSNDIRYRYGEFIYDNFFGKQIKIIYYYYNFTSAESFKLNLKKVNYICQTINDKVVEVTVYANSGTIQEVNLLDSLAHELEHMYQYTKANKVFSEDKVYEYALMLKDKCEKSTLSYCIGDVIYLSRKYEQEAYLNSLYTILMNCDTLSDFETTLYHSEVYEILRLLKFYLSELKPIKTFPTDLQKMGYTHHKFIKECTKAIEYMQWKIARVYNKATNDYRKKNVVEEKELYVSFVKFSIDMKNKGGIPWQKL